MNAISSASSLVLHRATRQRGELALVALLVVETLCLTLALDTQPLASIPSFWATAVGWAPQYLRLAISVAAMMLLLGGRRFIVALASPDDLVQPQPRVRALAVHVLSLFTFAWVSSVLFASGETVAANPMPWVAAWITSGVATLASWMMALFPARHWRTLADGFRTQLLLAAAAGTAVWTFSLLSEQLWRHLAGLTFSIVGATLRAFYTDVVSVPETLVLGTSRFQVAIAPSCSGYEGIGLVLAFLGVYLFACRKDLRFPAALILLPLGAVLMWLLNAARIATLIAIGTAGWRDVALGGFHSQAGWLLFNALCIGFVFVIDRSGLFSQTTAPHRRLQEQAGADSTAALLGPFVALLATAMLTGALSAGFDYLYPVRLVVVLAVLWSGRHVYRTLNWRVSLAGPAIGAGVFLIWMALMPADVSGKEAWPATLRQMPPSLAALWLGARVLGYVLLTPLAEELAFRAYLTRRFIGADIDAIPPGTFTWLSFLGSSITFGLFHGSLWLAGTIAGLSFAAAMYRRRSLADAVVAHATTNGLITCYVLVTGHWSVWS